MPSKNDERDESYLLERRVHSHPTMIAADIRSLMSLH